MTHDSNSQSYLILVVRLRVNLTDAAFKDVVPSHFEQLCNCFVFSAWDIAQQIFVVCTCALVKSTVIHHCYCIFIIAIIQVATQFQQCSDMQFFPHLISIVILTTCKVTLFEKQLFCLHNFNLLNVQLQVYDAKLIGHCTIMRYIQKKLWNFFQKSAFFSSRDPFLYLSIAF